MSICIFFSNIDALSNFIVKFHLKKNMFIFSKVKYCEAPLEHRALVVSTNVSICTIDDSK